MAVYSVFFFSKIPVSLDELNALELISIDFNQELLSLPQGRLIIKVEKTEIKRITIRWVRRRHYNCLYYGEEKRCLSEIGPSPGLA